MSGRDERWDANRTAAEPISPDPWSALQVLTPARIALGRTGASLPTREVLRFAMAHAQARDAVHTSLDIEAVRGRVEALEFRTLTVASAAPSREAYLRRPDLGRRLLSASRTVLESAAHEPIDLALVVADGLSSAAIHDQAALFLDAFRPWIGKAGWSLAPIVLATQGRVALGDEIGAILRARAVVILIGERPGLSAADSLGLYLTFAPRIGRSDAERNCISNVRPGGLGHAEAAFRLHWLLSQAFRIGLSGVSLKDESDLAFGKGDSAGLLA